MAATPPGFVLVATTAPDQDCAARIASALVERRLAACVQTLAACTSTYRWRGAIETEQEHPVVAKTSAARAAETVAAIRDLHPYEVPEIIVLPIDGGLDIYLDWIAAQTS